MDRSTQLDLIGELLGLDAAKSAYLDEDVTFSPVEDYTSPARFQAEQERIFRRLPFLAAHGSDLPVPGSFRRLALFGLPVLLTRDQDGTAHAFLNVCRHRGARLVEEDHGCKHVFSCPYHGWTWTNRGDLRGIPHQKQGFPETDKAAYGLKRLPCREQFGWIWVTPDPAAAADGGGFLDAIGEDLAWLQMDEMQIAHSETIDCRANWKLLIEGGLEAYHFKVAHKDTIGPHFPDNLSTYRMFGRHMRSVLPRLGMLKLRDQPRESWDIRRDANLLYTLFPSNQLLVQQDHIAWIQLLPLAADRTQLRLATVIPAGADPADPHWARNHKITTATLREDFEIGESVQAGLASGANSHLAFGRYEGALSRFAGQIREELAR